MSTIYFEWCRLSTLFFCLLPLLLLFSSSTAAGAAGAGKKALLSDSLVQLLSQEEISWEVQLQVGGVWQAPAPAHIEAQPAEHAAELVLPPLPANVGSAGVEKLTCEEYRGTRGAVGDLSGRCFLVGRELANDLFLAYEVSRVPGATAEAQRRAARRGQRKAAVAAGAGAAATAPTHRQSETALSEEVLSAEGASEADRVVGTVRCDETVQRGEKTSSLLYNVTLQLTLVPAADGDALREVLRLTGLRLVGMSGSYRHVTQQRAQLTKAAEGASFYRRWIYPFVFAAGLYGALMLISYGVGKYAVARQKQQQAATAPASGAAKKK